MSNYLEKNQEKIYRLKFMYIHYTYLGDKQILFFINSKMAAILDLWVKYWSNYLEDPTNKFHNPKLPRILLQVYFLVAVIVNNTYM